MNEMNMEQERTDELSSYRSVSDSCLPQSPDCWAQVRATVDLIAGKWAAPVLLTLHTNSPARYSELADRLSPISAKELAKQLKLLESAGLLERFVYSTKPPSVAYALTELGGSLHPVLSQLANWSIVHGATVRSNLTKAPIAPGRDTNVRIHRIR